MEEQHGTESQSPKSGQLHSNIFFIHEKDAPFPSLNPLSRVNCILMAILLFQFFCSVASLNPLSRVNCILIFYITIGRIKNFNTVSIP